MVHTQVTLGEIEILAQETSSDKRREMLNAVTDIFLVTQDDQNESDQLVFSDVMERVAYELEVEARVHLAQKICDAPKVSRQLIVRLANDEIDIARPVLERSTVLQDGDLLSVIRNRSQDHLFSIAGRNSVSEGVSSELVERGNERAVIRLTGNQGADISNKSFEKIVGRADENSGLVDALGSRSDIPAHIMNKIKTKVSGRMKSEFMDSHPDLDGQFVGEMIDRCAEDIDLDYCQESIAEFDKLHRSDGLNEEIVARLAREKRLPDLVHCLGLMTGLDNGSVSQCVLKAELPALAILCKSNSFSSSTFLALVEIRREDSALQSSALAQAARDYDALSPRTAERVMRFLTVRLKLHSEEQAAKKQAS